MICGQSDGGPGRLNYRLVAVHRVDEAVIDSLCAGLHSSYQLPSPLLMLNIPGWFPSTSLASMHFSGCNLLSSHCWKETGSQDQFPTIKSIDQTNQIECQSTAAKSTLQSICVDMPLIPYRHIVLICAFISDVFRDGLWIDICQQILPRADERNNVVRII